MEARMSTVMIEAGAPVHHTDWDGSRPIVFGHTRPLDQIVPTSAGAMRSSKPVCRAQLEVYRGLPYDNASIHHDVINAAPRTFFKA
jgi:hypothetical protein